MSLVYPRHLHPMSQWVLNLAPCIYKMKGHPEYQYWAGELVALASAHPLPAIREAASDISASALTTFDPWNNFLNETAQNIAFEDYYELSKIAYAGIERSPEAAFILALLAMEGWVVSMGDGLYQQPMGVAHKGWFSLPYHCAAASLAVGGLKSAKLLVDHAYNELMASKFTYYFEPWLVQTVQQHTALARQIQERYEIAASNLADDLRESCTPGRESFRAEFGAMLWTLGLVPESNVFRASRPGSIMPSRALVKQVVRQSLNRIPGDPFLQYIWLEMKDRPPFNLRWHTSLFAEINYRYPQMIFHDPLYEMILQEDPATVYAKNLIAWFRGDLTKDQADDYLGMFGTYIQSGGTSVVDWAAYTHMGDLATLLQLEFGKPPFDDPMLMYWKRTIDYNGGGIEWQSHYPDRPSLAQKANLPLYYFIEEAYDRWKERSQEALSIEDIANTVEAYRAKSLALWLDVIPPRVEKKEREAAGELLEEEWDLLTQMRGTYFLMLKPLLPAHYRRTASDMQYYFEEQEDPEKFSRSPDNARKQYKQLEEDLERLYQAMRQGAPAYTSKRLEPQARLADLAEAIRSHQR